MNSKLSAGKVIFLLFLIVGTIYIIRNNQKPYINNRGEVFGTYYNITYQSKTELHQEIKNVLEKVNASLSPFNRNSIITAINNNEDAVPDSMFITVFSLAQEISEKTGGAFDITVAPLVNAWGFGFKKGLPVDSMAIDSLRSLVGYKRVSLVDGKVVKQKPGTMLDCSAIAKGYGCDVVASMFDRNGIKNYMIEIGGEVVAKGNNASGKRWGIGINKPVDDPLASNKELFGVVRLDGKGMATSGNYRNFRYENGKKVAHTIDPRTGYPVEHSLLSATVIADDCATADAYATSFMVMGLEKAMEICSKEKSIDAYFIYAGEDGTLKTAETEGMKRFY